MHQVARWGKFLWVICTKPQEVRAYFKRNRIYKTISKSPFFDIVWYLGNNPDVATAQVDPIRHYLDYGSLEGRDPSLFFSTSSYLKYNPDVRNSGINPLYHYIIFGQKEGRKIARSAAIQTAIDSKSVVSNIPLVPQAKTALRVAPKLTERHERISIIICSDNQEPEIDSLLRSFLATNSYSNFEIIIVDLAKGERRESIFHGWSTLLPIKRLETKHASSLASAYNQAVSKASGEILLFLSAEIIFVRDILKEMASTLYGINAGAVGVKQSFHNKKTVGVKDAIIGMRLEWDFRERCLEPKNQMGSATDHILASSLSSFPFISHDILMCRKSDCLLIGGWDEKYSQDRAGADFCFKLRHLLNKELLNINSIHVVRYERQSLDKLVSEDKEGADAYRFKQKLGYQLRREYLARITEDDGSYKGSRLKVGIAVTTLDMASGAGDLYTALGLGNALSRLRGWDIYYLPKNQWYETADLDVYISMRDDVDIRLLKSTTPHMVTIAWMRNWLERWVSHPWATGFDIYLCSSKYGIDYIWQNLGVRSHLFPIAVDTDLFNIGPSRNDYRSDYVFTGNYWASPIPREIEEFNPDLLPFDFGVYGKNWHAHAKFSPYHRGFVEYSELPKIYSSTKLVIDDTVSHVTKLWGSMNSRVFEALATGTLVLTNNELGAKELFDDLLPTWSDADSLAQLTRHYLSSEIERKELAASLRKIVLDKHSYKARAASLSKIIDQSLSALRIAIKCPVPKTAEASAWGDYHFANALCRALSLLGYKVRVDLIPAWYTAQSYADDIVIVLRGLSEYTPSADSINLCWLISHPEKVTSVELNKYDHVFVASTSYAKKLKEHLKVPVSTLLQCSDPDIFYPLTDNETFQSHSLLFIGNSRKQPRKIVNDSVEQKLPLSIYGRDWEGRVPVHFIKGSYLPNSELRKYYSAAEIVLNDHWPDMARHGFISNRIFDVGLSGGFIISDVFNGMEVFEGLLETYHESSELAEKYDWWRRNGEARKEKSEKLSKLVLSRHTFGHRAEEMAGVIENLHVQRMAGLSGTLTEIKPVVDSSTV